MFMERFSPKPKEVIQKIVKKVKEVVKLPEVDKDHLEKMVKQIRPY